MVFQTCSDFHETYRDSFIYGCLLTNDSKKVTVTKQYLCVNMGTVLNIVNPPNTCHPAPCLLFRSNKIPWTRPFLSGVFLARPVTQIQRCHVVRRSRVSASLLVRTCVKIIQYLLHTNCSIICLFFFFGVSFFSMRFLLIFKFLGFFFSSCDWFAYFRGIWVV